MTDVLAHVRAALTDRYAIEREIGSGGMATVYLAEDLRHHRKVAVKVLRPQLAATLGPERFLREIEIAANLQHPNILPLLDSGEAGGFLYYVMPYVEGQSLRDKLVKEGELPIGDAVRILRDVVDALTEAHAHGVVHRDIKPENILLRGRHALVTDFGVAKAVSEATGREQLTTAGVALGTPAYMAPEQASADPHLDHRVDIYAVGAVAYELLTGRPVFMGTTPQMILSAHVTEAPVPITRLRETVPAALEAVVMRCLAKKPADRWQSADELLVQLEALLTPSGGVTPTQTAPVSAVPARRRLLGVAGVGAAVVLLAVAMLVVQLVRSKLLNITISDITPVTSEPGVEFQPAISPDGREVAFVAGPISAPHLAIRSTDLAASGGEVRLTDTSVQAEWSPSWSPDGVVVRFSACRDGNCAVSQTGRFGGAIRPVTVPAGAGSPAWSPDGARVAFTRGDTIFTSSAAEPAEHLVAVPGRGLALSHFQGTGWGSPHSLAWSPDGTRIAFVSGNVLWQWSGNVAPSSIWIVSAAGGEPQQVTTQQYLNVSPAWLDARHLLFVSNRDGPRGLYVVEVGPNGARGDPHILPGVADPHSISYSIAARKLAYAKLTLHQNVWAYPLNRTGLLSVRDGRPVTTGSQVIETHDVSPDGKWLAYDGNLRGNMDLYKLSLAGGAPIPLTDFPGDEFNPRWSPDGREVAFYHQLGSRAAIRVIPSEGGPPAAASPAGGDCAFPTWSPTGREIAFWCAGAVARGLWLVSRDSIHGPWHDAVQLVDITCIPLSWLPDGSGVLCASGERGTAWELVVVSPDGSAPRRYDLATANRLALFVGTLGAPALGGDSDVRFSRDGSTVYFAATHQDGRAGVWTMPASGGESRLVIAFDDPAVTPRGLLSVGPDRLYLTVSQYESDIWVMNLRY